MAIEIALGAFGVQYTLHTNAEPDGDIQFGMDFVLTSTARKPLAQLIFPATLVGTSKDGQWNVDNHNNPGAASSVVFAGADAGIITNVSREMSRWGKGVKKTKFAVYSVDLGSHHIQSDGVIFGYSINTDDANPQTVFEAFEESRITGEQKKVLLNRCPYLNFV
jgi:hypothetical protein